MDPLLINEEHIEARQTALNEHNKKTMELLGESCQKEFDAVHQAMKILSDAGVRAQLFPILLDSSGKRNCYQFGNGGNFATYSGGKATKESIIEAAKFNHFVVCGFHNWLNTLAYCTTPLPESASVYWNTIFYRYSSMVIDGMKWSQEGIAPSGSIESAEKYGS